MNNYTELLRQHNLKATPQRLAITDILNMHGHVSIEFLYEQMLNKFNSISLATIYKNINIMLENAFVQEVKIPHSKSVYELTKEVHSHLVCDNCGAVQDITVPIHTILEQTDNTQEFEIKSASVVFTGICKECKN
ncbi:MAG: transcriptional repressor [Campylobacterales bacterium]|nr:transcriptional repressor [Campylobacterales bacterium]